MCVTDSSVQSVYVPIEGQYRSRKVSRIVTEGVAYVRTYVRVVAPVVVVAGRKKVQWGGRRG